MDSLPPWVKEIKNRYLAGEASIFLVHGNVRDLFKWTAEDGKVTWVDIRTYLQTYLAKTRDVVAYFNISQGFQFVNSKQEKTFYNVVNVHRAKNGLDKITTLTSSPDEAVPLIEGFISNKVHALAVIIDYFETIAPAAEITSMSSAGLSTLVSMQRWASEPAFAQTDNLVILITENLADVSRRISSSPSVAAVHIPFPNVDERTEFIDSQAFDVKMAEDMDNSVLGKMVAGLTLVQIRNILRTAEMSQSPIDFTDISLRKKKIIEQECHGLVEFIPPRYNFSHVGGMERIKEDLSKVAMAVRRGNINRVPMGMIFVGPMGTGKTYLAEAFATESGLTCLKLKNFRDKYVGQTEANLEKVLGLVEALGYVLLIIDEADRGLASGDGGNDAVGSRVIARLKEFMSDTSHRGKVVILMMTNRPDKLDVDLKRPGRFDFKIPFFFPETSDEREQILRASARKNKLSLADDLDFTSATTDTDSFSAAELEAVMLAAANFAGDSDKSVITQEHLDQAAKDIIPSRDTRMLEYMEMLAVFECSAKRMLPERFQTLDTEVVQQKLDLLKLQLGHKAS